MVINRSDRSFDSRWKPPRFERPLSVIIRTLFIWLSICPIHRSNVKIELDQPFLWFWLHCFVDYIVYVESLEQSQVQNERSKRIKVKDAESGRSQLWKPGFVDSGLSIWSDKIFTRLLSTWFLVTDCWINIQIRFKLTFPLCYSNRVINKWSYSEFPMTTTVIEI